MGSKEANFDVSYWKDKYMEVMDLNFKVEKKNKQLKLKLNSMEDKIEKKRNQLQDLDSRLCDEEEKCKHLLKSIQEANKMQLKSEADMRTKVQDEHIDEVRLAAEVNRRTRVQDEQLFQLKRIVTRMKTSNPDNYDIVVKVALLEDEIGSLQKELEMYRGNKGSEYSLE